MTIKLYWWNGRPNFGDAINPLIVKYVSGKNVEWANNHTCNLFSIGSITHNISSGFNKAKSWRPAVWGSGAMSPHKDLDFTKNVDFFSVRGPITADLLGIKVTSFGDPGLLASELVEKQAPGDIIGIVPHHSSMGSAAILKAINAVGEKKEIKLIDVRNEDALAVVKEIQSCSMIFSESLHGLIIADALSIPNVWVSGKLIHRNPGLKFCDYFLSVGRKYAPPISYKEIIDKSDDIEPMLYYKDNVDKVKQDIIESFPEHLK